MSRHDYDWTPDVDDPSPGTAPKTRDQQVQESRARQTPARAPAGADEPRAGATERGNPSPVPLAPRTEPVRTHVVNASGNEGEDVRIGPGDAGASDTPTRSTTPVRGYRDMWRGAVIILALVFVGWLLLSFVTVG